VREVIIEWSKLVISHAEEGDGDAEAVLDEDALYEALGLRTDDARAGTSTGETMTAFVHVHDPEVEHEMREAAMAVDDDELSEPVRGWDKEDLDMSVGTLYPNMVEFRMAVKQHAIVHEFELGTEKSDKTRFRGFCRAEGCPWKIRARTQADKTVRVQIFSYGIHFLQLCNLCNLRGLMTSCFFCRCK